VELCRRLGARHVIDVFSNTFVGGALPGVQWRPVRAWRRRAISTVFTFLLQARRAMRKVASDLVHAQGLTCWGADVITAHVCSAARLARAGEGKTGLFARAVVPWERRFYRQRRARRLIGVSRMVEGEIRDWYGWDRPSAVIYHGTDVERFRPPASIEEKQRARAALEITDEHWQWLFVGEAVKGLGRVVDQLPRFSAARLLAVTRSDPSPYVEQARRLGVGDRLRVLGPRDDLENVYRAADVFVYPSPYDTFGMVVAEAMASGLPVIVGRDTGVAELIEDGRNGLLCDAAEPSTLAAALTELSSSSERAASLGEAGRRTIARHTWDQCADATERVYLEALQEGAGR
jgi:glycosyltransferase involved in cell wall biosynthesis